MPITYRQPTRTRTRARAFSSYSDSFSDSNSSDSSSEGEIETTPVPPPAPAPTDADDSIVLSDLVRTGEASRLRRRGAMRLDHSHSHGHPGPMLLPPNPNPTSNSDPMRPPSPAIVVVGSPSWESSSDPETEAGRGLPAREWERTAPRYVRDQPRPRRVGGGAGVMGERVNEFHHVLFCGGVDSTCYDTVAEDGGGNSRTCSAYEPSVLPLYPAPPTPPATATHGGVQKVKLPLNGCGALLHMHAAPRQRQGAWTWSARGEASGAVITLEPRYFDGGAAARIVRSACGCVREGVGCAICGNPLGTRYAPCKTAGDGASAAVAHLKPSSPLRPEGPRYWRLPHAETRAELYVYTFFASAVTSHPAHTFPPTSVHPPRRQHPFVPAPARARVQMYTPLFLSNDTAGNGNGIGHPTRAPALRNERPHSGNDNGNEIEIEIDNEGENDRVAPSYTDNISVFDRIMTASPAPLSDVGEEEQFERGYDDGVFVGRVPMQYLSVPRMGYESEGVVDGSRRAFDPDGEFMMAGDNEGEPGEVEKVNEVMLLAER